MSGLTPSEIIEIEEMKEIFQKYDYVTITSQSHISYDCCSYDSGPGEVLHNVTVTYYDMIETPSTEIAPDGEPFTDFIKGETKTVDFEEVTLEFLQKIHEILAQERQ